MAADIILYLESLAVPAPYDHLEWYDDGCYGKCSCVDCPFGSLRPAKGNCPIPIASIIDHYISLGVTFPHTLDISLHPELFL